VKRWRVPASGALAAILLVAIYAVGFHKPRSSRIAALTAEAGQLRAQQVPLRRSIDGLEKVAAREPEFNAALQLLEQLIPTRLAQPGLLVEMQAAARASGVVLTSVTFSDPQVPKDAPQSHVPGTVLVAMPFTVVVDGSYAGITDMLRRIEVGKDRAVLVGAVALTEADAGFPQLTGTWSAQAFALLPAADPLLADRNAPIGTASPAPAGQAEQPVTPTTRAPG
jgi:Tfp pilus assembly protein PilO